MPLTRAEAAVGVHFKGANALRTAGDIERVEIATAVAHRQIGRVRACRSAHAARIEQAEATIVSNAVP